ncbi:hypothetical protein C8Q79DRAFT_973775 [Trametes meyenii]|nr:hypothetical protein C8Q79DRAFT_973775 [Trametes meyenii]
MPNFINTSLVGGRDGTAFNDIYVRGGDGKFVINDAQKGELDAAHPIQQITVSSGWIVDGFSVTYQLADGTTAVLDHGSQFPAATIVKLNANEKLVGVFGRAGPQSYYHRELINSIGFVIFDTSTTATRIVGPFGNTNHSNQGTTFYHSDVLAFGGFAQPGAAAVGLCGLFFVKDVAGQ